MGDRNEFGDGSVKAGADIKEAISSGLPMNFIVSPQVDF